MRSDLGNLLKALARLDEAKVCFSVFGLCKPFNYVSRYYAPWIFFFSQIKESRIQLFIENEIRLMNFLYHQKLDNIEVYLKIQSITIGAHVFVKLT